MQALASIQLYKSTVDTLNAQSPDINPIENLWVHLKKKVEKRSQTNKNELIIDSIKKSVERLSSKYDISKLI